jgi:hypothetical protein
MIRACRLPEPTAALPKARDDSSDMAESNASRTLKEQRNGSRVPKTCVACYASAKSTLESWEMSTNVVNLDALIPREDFAVDEARSKATPPDRINIAHLDGHFFASDLRKPDFQRETTQWSPAKVVDLIRSFLDADLIPAVILWRAGRSIFVIDGSHRLSAMLAWILDDYGDRKKSLDHAGGYITEEQRKAAERTREMVSKTIGSFAQYQAFRNNRSAAPENMQSRLTNLTDNSFIAQWVTATDAKSAENSFFKINQQGTPVDPTERVILKSRASASAIAARAITHAGSGHKYWHQFNGGAQAEIEEAGRYIHKALIRSTNYRNAINYVRRSCRGTRLQCTSICIRSG